MGRTIRPIDKYLKSNISEVGRISLNEFPIADDILQALALMHPLFGNQHKLLIKEQQTI